VKDARDTPGTEHPAPARLEALAAGDEDASARQHVASCAACGEYVAVLQRQALAFAQRPDAEGPLRRAIAKAEEHPHEGAEKEAHGPRPRRAPDHVLVVLAAPLVAAAAVLVLVLGRAHPIPTDPRPPTALAPQPFPPGEGPPASDMRFKGALSVAAIRDRGGHQERLAGPFGVRAGDAVRIEVSVDHEGPITAGLLTDDGTWVVLLAPALLAKGTHDSEQSARFDATPTRAVLLVGDPAAVQRARQTRDFSGLVAWKVTPEP
jgi:hypothetical protein